MIEALLLWQRGCGEADFLFDSRIQSIINYESARMKYAFSMNDEDLDDLKQEAYLALLEKLKEYTVSGDHPEPALLNYVRQTVVAALRRYGKQNSDSYFEDGVRESYISFSLNDTNEYGDEFIEQVASCYPEYDPELSFEEQEFSADILHLIEAHLTPTQQHITIAILFDGYSQSEVAQELGITKQSVHKTYTTALEKLQKYLKRG